MTRESIFSSNMKCPKCSKWLSEIVELNLDVSSFIEMNNAVIGRFPHYFCNKCKTLSADISCLSTDFEILGQRYSVNISD